MASNLFIKARWFIIVAVIFLGVALALEPSEVYPSPDIPASRSAPVLFQATGDARFIDISADPEFPSGITFHLEAESPSPIVAVELYWHPAGDPALSAAYPEVENATSISLDHEVDLSVDYLPPGLDIVYFWRVIDANGAVSESDEATIWYMDESQDWETLTDDLVTLYWYEGDADFAEDVVGTATRSIERLRERFGVAGDEPIRIVAYGDESDFADALPPNSAEWIGGQAYPALNVIFAILEPGRGAEQETRRMIPHEVSHLMLEQATENPFNSPPNWLDEGLAVYNQETEDSRLAGMLDDAVDDGRLSNVRALNSSFPLDDQAALRSYAESWSIVTYIIEQLGDAEMRELIGIFKEEVSYDQAVEESLGMTIEELDTGWKDWLGYEGDAPVVLDDSNQVDVDPDDDSDLTRTEWTITAIFFGVGTLITGGFSVFAFLRWRKLGSLDG